MADVRCPMCGKPNPPELDVCRYCNARLKPLIISPSGEGGPSKSGDASGQKHPTSGAESAAPDWLSELREQKGEEMGAEPSESVPDWLQEIGGDATKGTIFQGESESSGAPDWLSRLGDESREKTPASPEPPSPAEKPEAGLEPTPQTPSEEELPDWLKELTVASESEAVKSPPAPPAETPPAAIPGEGEEPDWLKRVRVRQQADQAETPAVPEQAEGDNVSFVPPLSESPSRLPAAEAEAAPSISAAAESQPELPDWLSDLSAEEPTPMEPLPEKPAEASPEWLPQVEKPVEPAPEISQESVPDWLSGIHPEEKVSASAEAVAGGEEAAPAELAQPEAAEPVPDWLAKLEANVSEKPTSSVPALIMDEGETEGLLEAAPAEGEAVEPPDLSSMPEWLSQVSSEEKGPQPSAPPLDSELGPGLTPAELPSWLEAMRPVESAAPVAPLEDESFSQVESAGPLAGLRGALPAEPEFAQPHKLPAYSVKLQVSDAQQAHVALLESLLASEGQAKPVPPRAAAPAQYILRLLVAAVLIVAILIPLYLNQRILGIPQAIPPEVADSGQVVSKIPAGAPVLLAFDYDPGFTGEMEAVAEPIVGQLIRQNAYLTLVSTNPTGPVQADRFIRNLYKQSANPNEGFANLGFIPGGASGLQAFALSPRQVLPGDIRAVQETQFTNVWGSRPLSGVAKLSDFAAVMVLTENPDRARAWIEQVQPSLVERQTPLVMVLSAQAEPMVLPYYESNTRQVAGIVAGLTGGASYETLAGMSGKARTYWDSFGAGLLMVELFILIGGLVNIVLAIFTPQKQKESEGAS